MKKGWPDEERSREACQIRPPKSEARDKVSASSPVSFQCRWQRTWAFYAMFVQASQTKPLSAKFVGSYTTTSLTTDVLLAKITPCFEKRETSGCRVAG